VTTPWNFNGWLIGDVDGEPVNCRFHVRRDAGTTTEVWVHEESDTEHQSTLSRSPLVHAMACQFIDELHHARQQAARADAGDPVPPTSEGCRITSLHDYRRPDRAAQAMPSDRADEDQARARSR
jgi:hypothetical protein